MIFGALLLLQDAAPLPKVVESWYRLLDGGRHVGWMHEVYAEDSYRRETVHVDGHRVTDTEARRLFELRQTGKLDRPGRVEDLVVEAMRTIDSAWDRPVRVTPVRFDDGPTLEAWVDRYGRIVEGSFRSGLRFSLVKTELEAVGELPRPPEKRDDGCWKQLR